VLRGMVAAVAIGLLRAAARTEARALSETRRSARAEPHARLLLRGMPGRAAAAARAQGAGLLWPLAGGRGGGRRRRRCRCRRARARAARGGSGRGCECSHMMHLSAGCGAAVQLLRRKHYSSARRACTASNYSERYALMAWLDPAPRMPDPVRLRVELFLFFLLQNHMVFKTLYVERAGARDAARAELEARVAAGRGPGRLARRRRSACARWTARAATRSAAAASWSCRRAPAPGRARSAMLCQGRGQSLPRPARALCLQQLSRHPHLTS